MSAQQHAGETSHTPRPTPREPGAASPMTWRSGVDELRRHLRLLLVGPALAGAVAVGVTFVIAPTYTATTIFLPPQQSQSAAASALSSLSSLAGLAGGVMNSRSPVDQYVSMMQSATVSDRIIDRFKLLEVYESEFRVDARKELSKNVRILIGKKDGLVTVEVDDESPQRAAEMANAFVEELRRLTDTLAVTEAQQRRVFFETQLRNIRAQLVQAQQDLQASGFNPGALKAEPKAAAEAYAKLKAEATAAEVRLQILRGSLADNATEVRQQAAAVAALREQLARSEQAADPRGGADYVGKYREFKYQETLFELYARQYELARVDEGREGALVQVIDAATPPERRSRPKRTWTLVAASTTTLLLLSLLLLARRALGPMAARHDAEATPGAAH